MSNLEAFRLAAEHAAFVAQLEQQYPVSMQQGEEALEARLQELDACGHSLSWILFHRNRCLGYLVAWLQDSLLDVPDPDTVILVDDVQVVAGHPTALFTLLSLMAEDIWLRGWQSYSIEGVCRRSAYRIFKEQRPAIEKLGYELAGSYEYWDEELGEEMCWMRWDPLHAPMDARPGEEQDTWVVSQEAVEEEEEHEGSTAY